MIWLFSLISLFFGWLAIRDIHWPVFWNSFSWVEPGWFAGSVTFMILMIHLRALRWEGMIRPLIRPDWPKRQLRMTSFAGFAAVLILPLRTGEFVRPAFFRNTDEPPGTYSSVFGALLVERVLDTLAIVLILAIAFVWRFLAEGTTMPLWATGVLVTTTALFLGLLVLLAGIMRYPEGTRRWFFRLSGLNLARKWQATTGLATRLENSWMNLARGLHRSSQSRSLATALVFTVAYWGSNALAVWMLARAFALPAGGDVALLVLGFSAIGIFIPGAPGHIGNFHEFARLGLSTRIASALVTGPGMAFIVSLHALQTLFYCLLGGVAWLALQKGQKKSRHFSARCRQGGNEHRSD